MENSTAETKNRTETEVTKMVHKFKTTFQRLLNRDNQNVIETDYEKKESNSYDSGNTVAIKEWCGSFDDPSEEAKCAQFAKHIEDGLKEAREKHLKCEILIPCGLTMRIARDILIMSESEPCGIRGCSLTIHLDEKTKCSKLVNIQYDPSTVATFEIHLTLQEDTRHMVSVRKLMMQLTGCFKHSIYSSTPKMLCLAYKLEKQKLYRSSC